MDKSRYPLRGLDKSRGDFTHVGIVSTTDSKKRPEIDVSPQEENIFETIFLIELELIQTQMAQKPMLRAEVGMRVRCANKASAE